MVYSQKNTSSLRNDDRGVVAIEFALVAPVLFLLIMGIIEFGLIIWSSNILEAAVNDAARQGTTGNAYNGRDGGPNRQAERHGRDDMTREDYIRAEITRISGSLINPNELSISCTNLGDTFGNVTQRQSGNYQCGDDRDNETSCNNLGTGNDKAAVLYTATVCWKLFTPLVGNFFPDGQFPISSSMVVRNE